MNLPSWWVNLNNLGVARRRFCQLAELCWTSNDEHKVDSSVKLKKFCSVLGFETVSLVKISVTRGTQVFAEFRNTYMKLWKDHWFQSTVTRYPLIVLVQLSVSQGQTHLAVQQKVHGRWSVFSLNNRPIGWHPTLTVYLVPDVPLLRRRRALAFESETILVLTG